MLARSLTDLSAYRRRRNHAWGCVTSSGAIALELDSLSVVGGSGALIASPPTTADPAYALNYPTAAATTGSDGGLATNNVPFRLGGGRQFNWFALLKPSNVTAARYFFGLSDQAGTTMSGALDPAGNWCGFQLDTGAGHANWQAVSKDGTTKGITDTGIAAAASYFKFEMRLLATTGGPTGIAYLINGNPVAYRTANLPSANVNCRTCLVVETLENVSKGVGYVRHEVEWD